MLRLLMLVLSTVPLAACQIALPIGAPVTGHQLVESNRDAARVIFRLRTRAPLVIARDVSRIDALSEAPGTTYAVGREWLHLHSYPNPEAAAAARLRLVSDPRNALTRWAGQPHAFQCNSVVAFYLGADRGSLEELTRLCGPPMGLQA